MNYYSSQLQVSVVLTNTTASIVEIIQWLKTVVKNKNLTVYQLKHVAEQLKQNPHIWYDRYMFDVDFLDYGEYTKEFVYPIATIVVNRVPSEFEKDKNKQDALRILMERGASGDAEAAIQYCLAEKNGEVNHGAMG